MAHQQPQQQQYDFITAISRLQEKIQQLSATKAAAAGPSSKLGVAWAFAKQNRGNVLLLLTFYSMSTASVVGSIMAQHRLQVWEQYLCVYAYVVVVREACLSISGDVLLVAAVSSLHNRHVDPPAPLPPPFPSVPLPPLPTKHTP